MEPNLIHPSFLLLLLLGLFPLCVWIHPGDNSLPFYYYIVFYFISTHFLFIYFTADWKLGCFHLGDIMNDIVNVSCALWHTSIYRQWGRWAMYLYFTNFFPNWLYPFTLSTSVNEGSHPPAVYTSFIARILINTWHCHTYFASLLSV